MVSRPIRSARASGPIGCAQPSTMPWSMSVGRGEAGVHHADRGEDVGDQQRVDDEARPGPASGSPACPASRWRTPRRAPRSRGRSAASSTSSTSLSTGTGLKKWMPMTFSGRLVAMPELHDRDRGGVGGQDRVAVATTLSSAVKMSSLIGSTSATASTARSMSAKSPMSAVNGIRAKRGARRRRRRACPCQRAVQRLDDALAPGGQGVGVDLGDDHVEAGAGADLGDARAHQPAADDANLLDVTHALLIGSFRAQTLRRYWPPTSKKASVIWPSEHTRAASMSTAKTFSPAIAAS